MSTNPRQVGLSAGTASATVDLEHGARLASLVLGGRERLIGPPDPADGSIRWGCFLMAPWPGRLADARLRWQGRTVQIGRNHGRHAIHGLVYARRWTLDATTATTVRASTELGPAGWPFAGRVRQSIELQPDGLIMEAEIETDGPAPAALGWHPWFDRCGGDPSVTVESDRVLETRGMIPTGATLPVAGRTDLRRGPRLGLRRLDHAYTDVRSPAVIAWSDLELRIEFDAPISTVVVHTPARAFCVEPQTAWPNALGLGSAEAIRAGAVMLGAGERLAARLRCSWTEISA